MKRLLFGFGTIIFAISLIATAQTQTGPGQCALCDKDKDGKCDMTGQPVGPGKGMAGMRQGGGCRGRGQQSGGCRKDKCPAAQPAPSPTLEPKK